MKLLLYVLMVVLPALVYSQTNLSIKGKAPLFKDGTEISIAQVLPKRLSSEKELNITKIKNHRFEFSLRATGAGLYHLKVNERGQILFLDPGKVEITIIDSIFKNISIIGSLTTIEYNKYKARLDSIALVGEYGRARVDYSNYARNENIDTALARRKMQRRDSLLLLLHQQFISVSLKWIKQYPNSYINTNVLYDQITYMPEEELKAVFFSMPAALKNNVWAKELRYRIDSLFIGATAPVFSQADINGKQISLTSYRGKYILLDFWASWCIPCRKENPNLVKAMYLFKNRNFTILSISLDDEKGAWHKAIKQDNLFWPNLSDLKGWQNTVPIKFYVSSIPANYLISPDGKIIAKDLYGNDLLSMLNKLIN
jgi:peroxiredoxin